MRMPSWNRRESGAQRRQKRLDARNRLVQHGTTTNTYNGDGVLVAQTTGSTTTRYTQDLAAPLPQILSDGTQTYVYGHERLFAQQGSARSWYLGDALGSVRATVSSTGAVLAMTGYDPWGTVQGSPIAPFGFMGELQQAGMVYLRARWYTSVQSTFTPRDPFDGFAEQPGTLHPYHYAAHDPVRITDPSGKIPPILIALAIAFAVGVTLAAPAPAYAP